jgi:alpha-D-ribose 1-methylphosphonate 5-triphosphate synthase subunit PhnI
MAYVAVSGGEKAIAVSLDLLEYERVASEAYITSELIAETLSELVEQVQSEGSLWAPQVASVAIEQARGNVEEAVFLIRAYRSTLERLHVSRVIDTAEMVLDRRISSAFKDIPGGQVLGATRDYSHRLIDFDLIDETSEDVRKKATQLREKLFHAAISSGDLASVPKVCDYLRSLGLISSWPCDDTDPVDATKTPLAFPSSRSLRLQTLSRGMTQTVISFGYAAIRGFGQAHPTIGELRRGNVPITVDHPVEPGDADDAYYLGSIPVCEVESIVVCDMQDVDGMHHSGLDLGYGLVYGGNENKAIAMSVLDYSLRQKDARYPTQDEEFVLYHIDSVEATGFISHLKLPHYVTFQSKLDSARRSAWEVARHAQEGPTAVAHGVAELSDVYEDVHGSSAQEEVNDAAKL